MSVHIVFVDDSDLHDPQSCKRPLVAFLSKQDAEAFATARNDEENIEVAKRVEEVKEWERRGLDRHDDWEHVMPSAVYSVEEVPLNNPKPQPSGS